MSHVQAVGDSLHLTQGGNCIHVGGTNGKGSVSLKIARALEKEGYRVGLYTSPHLFTFRERVQVDGQMIAQEEVVRHLDYLFRSQEGLTYFDYVTLMALRHFQEKETDFNVLEVGLGGRQDSTNIIREPLLSVITSISLDHMDSLGHTLLQIASNKAGIIKTHALLGPNCPHPEVFQKETSLKGGTLQTMEGPESGDYREENSQIARYVYFLT